MDYMDFQTADAVRRAPRSCGRHLHKKAEGVQMNSILRRGSNLHHILILLCASHLCTIVVRRESIQQISHQHRGEGEEGIVACSRFKEMGSFFFREAAQHASLNSLKLKCD